MDFGLLYHEAMRLAIPVFFVALFAVVIFFATYKLTESPPVWYDEGIYTQGALGLALRGTTMTQVAPDTYESAWSTSGGFSFLYPVALSYRIFGPSVLAGRAVMVGFIFLLACAVTALLYILWGTR